MSSEVTAPNNLPVYQLSLEEAVKLYQNWKLSFFPLIHGDKKPLAKLLPEGSWKPFQERPPNEEEVNRWLGYAKEEPVNLAVVCGKISEGLIVIDFENEKAFKDFIGKVKQLEGDPLNYAIGSTWIVKTGRGYHVYLKLPYGPEVRTKPKLKEGVDIKGEGGYVVAPPSLHPSGATYTFIVNNPKNSLPQPINEADWRKLLRILGGEEEIRVAPTGRRLDDSLTLKIVETLRPAYQEGSRDLIVLFLSGWLRKVGVNYDTARRLIELLAEKDEEKQHRLYVLDRTYGLRGNPPTLEEMKGRTGLQEVLEEVVGEEKALEILRGLEEALGVSSPFKDTVFELLDYDKQLYALANLRKGVIARARRTGEGLRYRERVAVIAPLEVTVYENPLGGPRRFKVRYEGLKTLTIGPAYIDDHIAALRLEGLVYSSRLINDILPAILNAYIKKGKATVVHDIDKPGFFYMEGELKLVNYELRKASLEELKEALELLTLLAETWYEPVEDKFATVIKWAIEAPFHYAYKQSHPGIWKQNLFLIGDSRTGKTTLARIGLKIWGLDRRHEKSGGSIDTVARLGQVLSTSTFPVLINEPGGALAKEEVVEVIKAATEGLVARGKFIHGSYQEIPALASLILTSNRPLPLDDALRRRFKIIRFYYSEKIPEEAARRFEEKIIPELEKLSALGPWIWKLTKEDPQLLDNPEELLRRLYETVDLKPPPWIQLEYREPSEEELEESLIESVRSFIVSAVNETYSRYVKKIVAGVEYKDVTEASLEERLKTVAVNDLLPWLIRRGDEYIITTTILEELKKRGIEVVSLKSLADMLRWEYSQAKIGGRKGWVIRIPENDLYSFLSEHNLI